MELIVVIGIFIVISGMLLVNFRRSQQGDIVRVTALRFATEVQRMQSAALSGGIEDRAAVAYGVHLDPQQADRYVLFGDRIRCQQNAEGAEICSANGRFDAGAVPAEELPDGTIVLPSNVRIAQVEPGGSAIDALFQPPRGTVRIAPLTTEVRVRFQHTAYDDARTVTINRISGRVNVE